MLDRARDADRNVQIRRHHLAGLTDLPIVRGVAGVHCRARSANGSAEPVSNRLDVRFEVLRRAKRATTGDDNLCGSQLWSIRFGQLLAAEYRYIRIGTRWDFFDRGGLGTLAYRLECRRAHRDHLLWVGRLHRLDCIAGVDRALEGVRPEHLRDVRDLHDIEQRGNTGHDVLAGRCSRRNEVFVGASDGDDERGQRLGKTMLIAWVVSKKHLFNIIELSRSLGDAAASRAGYKYMNRSA